MLVAWLKIMCDGYNTTIFLKEKKETIPFIIILDFFLEAEDSGEMRDQNDGKWKETEARLNDS